MGTRATKFRASAGTLLLLLGCTGQSAQQSHGAVGPPTNPAQSAGAAARPQAEPECLGGESWREGPTTACSGECRSQSFIVTRCVESRREEAVLQAPCECGPATLSAELSGCRLHQLSLLPLQLIPRTSDFVNKVDGCKLELTCQPGKLSVSCDGEQDGTGTSLCECYLDGQTVRMPRSDPWPGEGASTCHTAATLCLQAAKRL